MYGEQFQKWLAGGIGVNVFLEMDPEEAIAKEFDCEGVQRQKQKLDLSYVLHHNYPPNLLKDKKRAVRKRAATLVVDKGKVFLKRKGHLVKVVTAADDKYRILESYATPILPLDTSAPLKRG